MSKLHLKKFCFLLIVMLVSFSAAFSQGYNTTNWKFSNPKQFGFTIIDVDYFDNNTAIAVGQNGGIAKTTDGGRNWTYGVYTYINAGGFKVAPSFNDVHFITATTAYAVGNAGVMAKTTDGGATWNFVITPLYPNAKIIYTTWFINANKGYIGGEYNNTADSLPKLYVTLNGGATWDSIAAPPVNGVSRVGYLNNPLIPSVLFPVDAKLKTIQRIEFINDSTGYICGSNAYGVTIFPNVSQRATSTTICTPLATLLTSGSMAASLLWKFKSGVLTDYSISKERIGYSGNNTAPASVNCTTTFGNIGPTSQTFRAMNVINDSTVVMMSFNNNYVVKVNTGVNDSTANVNAPGVFEKGKYQMLNYPFPPTAGPDAGPPIPPVQVLLASNPYQIRRTAAGTLAVAGNGGRMFTSVDTGRNWIQGVSLPQGQNYSADGVWGFDIAPNGRFLSMGTNGVTADSLPGGSWQSNYLAIPHDASYSNMEFTDCNNGIAAGGSAITVTTDGGNSWIDRNSPVLGALFAQINSVNYLNPAKAYFTTSIGNLYRTTNQAVTLSPVFAEPFARLTDLATIGNDSLWMTGVYINSPIAAANRQGAIFRSFDNGANWDTVRVGPMGSATYLQFAKIQMATRLIGYAAGNRNAIWKTINGGATWTDISPSPALIATMSFTGLQALNKDTVFACGNGFPFKVVYRTIDGGATWVDITSNITSLIASGNLNNVLMHDVNNGYVCVPGGALLITNNSGASWTLDLAPTGNLFTAMAFVPKTVGPSVSMVNRKMFVSGPNVSGAPMMEYGNPANTTVNSTELIAGSSCTSPNSGSITITATGGVAPYMYQLGAGPFQPSNVFSGLAAGTYTITIKDSYCGLLTKTVTITQTDNQVLNVTGGTTVCAGVPVQLTASGNSISYSWSPTTGLSNPNIANPIATVFTTTTYTVTGTLNNCVKTAMVTVTVSPNTPIIIVADPGTTICEGDPTLLTVYDAGNATGGTIPLGAQTGTFAGNARGYFFTAPTNFTMTALRVPTDASAGNQNVAVVRFTGATPPPAFPATTNAFTTLFVSQNNPAAGNIPVNIAVTAGDVIGILGTRGADVNSYWINPNTTTIGAFTVNLTRMGMQFPLATTAPQQIWTEAASISRVFFDYTIGSLGPQSTGTFLWSPAAGLSSTTSNPVAASPMNTTTYTVTRTTVPGGCVASAQVTITVNKRPTVTTQPTNQVSCAGTTVTFTVAGTGTALTYQWQVSTTGCAGPWTNLANGTPYSNVTTATLTVNPVTQLMSGYAYRCVLGGACAPVNNANISNCATLSVNPNPTVSITPTGPVCGGVAGINGTLLSTAAAAPPVPGVVTVNSGTINLAVPDNTANGVSNIIAMAGVPANATITNVSVTLNMSHTYPGDMIYNLKAPNGQILSLYKYGTGLFTGPVSGNATWGWYGAKVSQTGSTAWSTVAVAPFIYNNSTSWKADAINTPVAGAVIQNPTGFVSAATSFTDLYTTPASTTGNWTLAMADGGPGDVGSLASWSLTIDYTTPGSGGGPTLTYVWSPLAGLYTNSITTIPYTGTNLPSVYAAPTVATTYTVRATDVATGCFTDASVLVNYTPPAPTVTPNPVAMCLGDAAVKLKSTSAIVATPAVWTPAGGLFSDANASIAYVAGTAVDSVWTKPSPSGVYNYDVTVKNVISTTSTITTPTAGGNGNNLVAFNVKNNNPYAVTFSAISSNTFGSGAVVSRVFYKAAPIAGNPGAITVANGWNQFGTANNTVVANTLNPLMSGLSLSIPAGATYGIALDMTGATFPAYTNGTGTIVTYSNAGCDLITDGNVGWGGPAAPGTPANNPRNFNGSITLIGSGPGTCTSPARRVVVTVNQPTTAATQPVAQTICTDKVATFTVVAAGTGPFSYQWQVSTTGVAGPYTNIANGGVYSGATTATLTITAPPVTMNGYFYRVVINGAAPCAAATSTGVRLTVNPLPTIVISANRTSLIPGLTATITSTVSPNAAVEYTWLRNGVAIPSASTGTLIVDIDGLGDYQLRVKDVNGCTNLSNIITIKDSVSAKCFIYPNPTSGQFQVRYHSVASNVLPRTLTVYDAKGDRVFTQLYTIGRPYDRMDVDMRAYGKGLYWVEIGDRNGNRLTMCRVVIQ
ncbi:MAG: T9SS type A sorting domain-containing protein [Ferruginibacter sp.]